MALTSSLGKKTAYIDHYSKELLFPISRKEKRDELGIKSAVPFFGCDIWNAYEISWLNEAGKPEVRIAEIIYSSDSPNIIESKSLKLYLNSLNGTKFLSEIEVRNLIKKDLSEAIKDKVIVKFFPLEFNFKLNKPSGICIDHLNIGCTKETKTITPEILSVEDTFCKEHIYSNLLKSNCPVTKQPDWATVEISYEGQKIDNKSLLQYIISYRDCAEFHEQCVERMFVDIKRFCKPKKLTIYARYTRRGGIDINPFRTSEKFEFLQVRNSRLARQ